MAVKTEHLGFRYFMKFFLATSYADFLGIFALTFYQRESIAQCLKRSWMNKTVGRYIGSAIFSYCKK